MHPRDCLLIGIVLGLTMLALWYVAGATSWSLRPGWEAEVLDDPADG